MRIDVRNPATEEVPGERLAGGKGACPPRRSTPRGLNVEETQTARGFFDHVGRYKGAPLIRSAEEETNARGTGIRAAVADVASRDDADRVVAEAVEALGGLDVLVNNAGVSGPTGRIEELDARQWDDTVAANLNSRFYFLRGAVPYLKRSEAASIVAMSSVAGRLGYASRTPYASTKWAIVGLMKSLAIELGPDNVRVDTILPGIVDGSRMERVIEARAQATGTSFEAMKETYLSRGSRSAEW